jgi:hypothetical protein
VEILTNLVIFYWDFIHPSSAEYFHTCCLLMLLPISSSSPGVSPPPHPHTKHFPQFADGGNACVQPDENNCLKTIVFFSLVNLCNPDIFLAFT